MFAPDKPIETVDADSLNRSTFSKSLADAILSYKPVDSLVMGLYGKWGSGKTSIINMSIEFLNECSTEEKTERPIIIKFNPWNFSDQQQLITQFFKQMADVIGKDIGSRTQKIGELLENYAKIFEPLMILPGFSDYALLVKLTSWVMKSLGNGAKRWGEKKARNAEQQKKEISDCLRSLNKKIIVIIDDIDRLNSIEIRQIFQLVKVLGDFPNTIYILAFDKDVVVAALTKVQEREGATYLEKIVQVPFELPTVSDQEILRFLFAQLDEVIAAAVHRVCWDETYWGNILHSGYKDYFRTLRDVKRYINILRFNAGLTGQNVNMVDMMAITAIQVFDIDVYMEIRNNKQLFAGVLEGDPYVSNKKENLKHLCDDIIRKTKSIRQERMRELLERMFPKLNAYYGNINHGYSSLQKWRKDGRISSPDIFDTYFRLTIPQNEIGRNEMSMFLSQIDNKEGFRKVVTKLVKEGRVERFLELLEDYTASDIPLESIPVIISVLFDMGDQFPSGKLSFASFDADMKIVRLTYQLMIRVENQDNRFNILKGCIEEAQNSLYPVVHQVIILDQEHDRIGKNENKRDSYTVSEEQLNQLEKIALSKIIKWSQTSALFSHPHLMRILYSWKRWGAEEISQYVTKEIIDDEKLLCFLTANLSVGTQQSVSDYVATEIWEINLNGLKDFIDIPVIEPRIRNILTSNNFVKLNSKEQIAVRSFIEAYDAIKQGPLEY